jgi:gamma-glutamyltranspeptidase/glutathione hydrolase
VVAPHACGLGGDAFILIHDVKSGKPYLINGSGEAPQAARIGDFEDGLPKAGVRSITVPGAVGAWSEAIRRFGTWSFGDVLAPALRYATEGFAAYEYFVENVRSRQLLLQQNGPAAALFLPNGQPPKAGEVFRQPELASVLHRLIDQGETDFYSGHVADRIVEDLRQIGGLLSNEDFRRHSTLWQEPIAGLFDTYEIFTAPPNSWGTALLMFLRVLEADGEAGTLSRQIDLWQCVYAAAERSIGDPRLTEADARQLLRSDVRITRAAQTVSSGGSDTSCVIVMDETGNSVSLIQSLCAPFGSCVVARGTGIALNNRLTGFNAIPNHPNCIGPNKRPAHTLVPVLVSRKGAVELAMGTPGAAGQSCTLAQVLHKILKGFANLQDAVCMPRWSVSHEGEPILDASLDSNLRSEVLGRFPATKIAPPHSATFGSIKAVARSGDGFIGVAETQRRAAAATAW